MPNSECSRGTRTVSTRPPRAWLTRFGPPVSKPIRCSARRPSSALPKGLESRGCAREPARCALITLPSPSPCWPFLPASITFEVLRCFQYSAGKSKREEHVGILLQRRDGIRVLGPVLGGEARNRLARLLTGLGVHSSGRVRRGPVIRMCVASASDRGSA